MAEKGEKRGVEIVRWAGRISAGLAAGLILFIFIGEGIAEGFAPFLQMTSWETLMMVAFAVMWLGLVLSWKWELTGALLTIAAAVAFYLLDYLFSGTFPRGPYFLIFSSPSLIFLYYGLRSRQAEE
ncbi:MAG: hypothetical protein KGY39_07200 [Anaerolineales bacterium]|nr:hypothetical protein [Anaerolineales bacterium]